MEGIVWAFGCSITHGDELPEKEFIDNVAINDPDLSVLIGKSYNQLSDNQKRIWFQKRHEYFGTRYDELCNSMAYPKLLAEKLGYDCKNLAGPGFGQTATSILVDKYMDQYASDDIVIVASTFVNRLITPMDENIVESHNINYSEVSKYLEDDVLPDPLSAAIYEFAMLNVIKEKMIDKNVNFIFYDTIDIVGHLNSLHYNSDHKNDTILNLALSMNPFNSQIDNMLKIQNTLDTPRCMLNHYGPKVHKIAAEYIHAYI